MSICVKSDASGQLYTSTAVPCDGYLLVSHEDVKDQLDSTVVMTLFVACASLYALVYVFKVARRMLGF